MPSIMEKLEVVLSIDEQRTSGTRIIYHRPTLGADGVLGFGGKRAPAPMTELG